MGFRLRQRLAGHCLFALLLCTAPAFAQEDESGITEDEALAAGEPEPNKTGKAAEPERTTAYPAREPGKKVATVTVKKKVFSLALPADWVLQPFDDPKSELAWGVLLPGSTKRANLYILREEEGYPKAMPYYRAEWFRREQPDATVEVRTKPSPRVVVRRTTDGTESVSVYCSLTVRNNGYTLQLSCSPDDCVQAEADLVAAARTFTAEVEIWPPVPKGYEVSQEGAWLVARAPDVTAPLAPLVKALKDIEKRFRRDHGPLPKGDAIVVLVHASKAAAGKVDPKAAESENDYHCDFRGRRLFAVPLAKDNTDQEAMLAFSAQAVLLLAKYGDARPDWIQQGEGTIAAAEVHSGKPLPSLDEGFVAWLSTLRLHTLDEMEALRASDTETWRRESFFYVAALREGKYRKQYRAFLDDFSETGDALGACARHIGTIDQAEFRDSTNKFLSTRIKEEKRKQEKH